MIPEIRETIIIEMNLYKYFLTNTQKQDLAFLRYYQVRYRSGPIKLFFCTAIKNIDLANVKIFT